MKIGSIEFDNPFFAAPMAGVSDAAMRKINIAEGAALVYTEMISAKGLIYNNKKTSKMLEIDEDERPAALQLFGSEVDIMRRAAYELNICSNVILDFNMGCPVPKVVKNGEGSALMRQPMLAAEIVRAMIKESVKPVTVKIRLGWDEEEQNYLNVAKRLEDAGAAAITLHGRTRQQYYLGDADRGHISELKKNVSIPVIGNGDVFSGTDAVNMLKETGCDFVMIARGMLGNPWIFKEALSIWRGEEQDFTPTTKELREMVRKHLGLLCDNKGEERGVREMRKHFCWYAKGRKDSARLRRKANDVSTAEEFGKLIDML